MITREDLQRLHQRAVGNSRRYYADGRVNDLVAAVGEYLNQDDPTVEIAYLRATIGDLKAGVIPGQNSEQPERVAYLTLQIVLFPFLVGKERKPLTHRQVLRQVCFSGVCAVLVVIA